jgi:hypothetical protein
MAVADDIRKIETGETGNPNDPFEQGWFSRVRARKVLGDNINKKPFVRVWAAIKTVASPMSQDKITAIADAIGWRIVQLVNPDVPKVLDFGDMSVIQFHYFLLTADKDVLRQAITNAKLLNKWPSDYTGIADFEVGK